MKPENDQNRRTERPPREPVRITPEDEVIIVDANRPRLMRVVVLHDHNAETERHLKVTGKGRLTLI
jgi:hypothetical protein